MNHNVPVPADDPLQDAVDQAISATISKPIPQESLDRTLGAAMAWDPAPRVVPRRLRYSRIRSLAAALLLVAVIGLSVFGWIRVRERASPAIDSTRDSDSFAQRESETSEARQALTFFEPRPVTAPIVADAASIFVCVGPDSAVEFGQLVPHRAIVHGSTEEPARMHFWDWSKSDTSRVMDAPRFQYGSALSPDGTMLLTLAGKSINIVMRETRSFEAFAVEEGQRLEQLWFSPSGRYVAARIRVDEEGKQAHKNQSSTRYRWALRIVELAADKIVAEFVAGGYGAPAFSPDEASIIYTRPLEEPASEGATDGPDLEHRHVAVRRDLRSGQVESEYKPAYDSDETSALIHADRIFEPMGICVSPDGRFVAIGYYYGQLFIWETASGQPVLHHLFLRDDRTRDTFFQAAMMRFSPDSRLLAMASGSRLKVLDTRTGAIVAEHYHESTPKFAHLRWSPDAHLVTLVTQSGLGGFGADNGFPPKPTADIMPRVYDWDWKTKAPSLKKFNQPE